MSNLRATKKLLPLVVLCSFVIMATAPAFGQRTDNYRGLLVDKDVKIEQTTLPIVYIETGGTTILRYRYVAARMTILHNGEGIANHGDTTAHPNQHIDYTGHIAIRYRGNTSFELSDKKPYLFRTLRTATLPDDGGKKQKVSLLGMPEDNKWCLLAPWSDETMIRDILTFELARPWMDWVPRCRLCEVMLDGTYMGVYILAETVSKGKHRLDLDDVQTDADGHVTGDWHISADHAYYDLYYNSPIAPWLALDGSRKAEGLHVRYQYRHPDFDELNDIWDDDEWLRRRQELQPVIQAVNDAINAMEESFLTDDWADPMLGYASQIDPTSFADYMLATELSMNIDGYRLSTHLYRHADSRAAEGKDPRWHLTLWDYNIAWGNANFYSGQRTDRWQYMLNLNHSNEGEEQLVPFYWYRLLQDPAFWVLLYQRWDAYRLTTHSDTRLFATIDSLATLITSSGAAERNERAWEVFKRKKIWPIPYYATDYADAVRNLKAWARKRLDFIDKNLVLPRTGFDGITVPKADGKDGHSHTNAYGASPSAQPAWSLDGRRISTDERPRPPLIIRRHKDGTIRKVASKRP